MLTCGLLRSNFSLPMPPISFDTVGPRAYAGGPVIIPLPCYLALHSRDDFFRDVLRYFFVTRKVHGEAAAALRARTQFRRITEHFAQRHARLDDLSRAPDFRAFELAAA